jgi:hypothetical protein
MISREKPTHGKIINCIFDFSVAIQLNYYYQLAFFMPEILPDLINFKIYILVNLLNLFFIHI